MKAYAQKARRLAPQAIGALPLAGLPIASVLSYLLSVPMCYPRPPKTHGTQNTIEGGVAEGSQLLLIDDLATRGVSAISALPLLREKYHVRDLLVLIDRQSGAQACLAQEGVRLHSVFQLRELLDFWKHEQLITSEQYAEVQLFLSES